MNKQKDTQDLLGELVTEVRRLNERVDLLESTLAAHDLAPGQIDEQRLAVITSAIAAYLGIKPHIRQIRLVSTRSWAQQGRATIHASHTFARYGH